MEQTDLESDSKSKVMILLSDGSNNAGELDPLTAADLASKFDIKIYTIELGLIKMFHLFLKGLYKK